MKEEINDLLCTIRQDYAEWMDHYEQQGCNPESIVSVVLAKKYLKLKQQYEICDYVKHL